MQPEKAEITIKISKFVEPWISYSQSEEENKSQIFRRAAQIFSEANIPRFHHLKPLPAYSVLEGNLYLKEQNQKFPLGKFLFFFTNVFQSVNGWWGLVVFFVWLEVSDIIHISSITTLGVRKFKYLPSWSA